MTVFLRFSGVGMKKNKQINEGKLDWLQGGLDIAGLVPGIGEAADGLNAVISLGRGNPLEALLSVISMVPAGGDVVGKGGKITLKVLNPAMDLIKASKPAAEIIKKVGPKKIAKIKPILLQLKKLVVKEGDKVKEIFSMVKKADLKSIEKLLDIQIPKVARSKVEKLLKKVGDKLPAADILSIFEFLKNIEFSEKEEVNESMLHGNSLKKAMFAEEHLNESFMQIGKDIQKIIES